MVYSNEAEIKHNPYKSFQKRRISYLNTKAKIEKKCQKRNEKKLEISKIII